MKKHPFARLVARSIKEYRVRNMLYVVCGASLYDYNKWWCEPARHCKKTLPGIIRQSIKDGCMNKREIKIYEINLDKIKPIYQGHIPLCQKEGLNG